MDMETINTIITSFTSIVVAALGLLVGKKDITKKTNRMMYERQLNSLIAPMDQILAFPSNEEPDEILEKLILLINDNYILVPPVILHEVQKIALSEVESISSFNRLSEMTASYFNWLRKYLHYPYDNERIMKNCSPVSNKWNRIYRFCENLFILLMLGYLIVVFTTAFLIKHLDEQQLIMYIVLPFGITYIGMRIVAWVILKDKRMEFS